MHLAQEAEFGCLALPIPGILQLIHACIPALSLADLLVLVMLPAQHLMQ